MVLLLSDGRALQGFLSEDAKGYLLKDSLRKELIEAIRAVAEGRSFFTRKVSRPCAHIRPNARIPNGQSDSSRMFVMPSALRCFWPSTIICSSSSLVG